MKSFLKRLWIFLIFFILVLNFIQHLLQLIQCWLLCKGYHTKYSFQKNENVSENLKWQRSLREILKRKNFWCNIRLVYALQYLSCIDCSNVTLTCGKESNQASSGIVSTSCFFRAVPRLDKRCCGSGKYFHFKWLPMS